MGREECSTIITSNDYVDVFTEASVGTYMEQINVKPKKVISEVHLQKQVVNFDKSIVGERFMRCDKKFSIIK